MIVLLLLIPFVPLIPTPHDKSLVTELVRGGTHCHEKWYIYDS